MTTKTRQAAPLRVVQVPDVAPPLHCRSSRSHLRRCSPELDSIVAHREGSGTVHSLDYATSGRMELQVKVSASVESRTFEKIVNACLRLQMLG